MIDTNKHPYNNSDIITLDQISLRRGDSTILQDISWKIKQGEHWALIGLNGSGKSSLINILSGYNFPSSGEVTVLGEVFGKTNIPDLRKRIGIVSGWIDQQLPSYKTVLDTVISGHFASFGLYQQVTEQMKDQALSILKQFDFEAFADRPINTLSQGERQKVLIFRALMTNPELLILDEPMNSLDLFAKEEMLSFLEEIVASRPKLSLLLITHQLDEVTPLFSKVALLKEGKFFDTGLREDILTEDVLNDFYQSPIKIKQYTKDRIIVIPDF